MCTSYGKEIIAMKNNYNTPEIVFEMFMSADIITFSKVSEHSGDELDYSTL